MKYFLRVITPYETFISDFAELTTMRELHVNAQKAVHTNNGLFFTLRNTADIFIPPHILGRSIIILDNSPDH